uniref:Uncharacterized protein n=1 Tax=Nomascus leucogenys TaxID=61853 RepID=A0A2I3GN29_NOMLE
IVKTRRGQLGLVSSLNRILSAVQNTLCTGPSSQAPPQPPQASPPAAADHSRTPSLLASSHSASGGESLFQLYIASLAWPQNCCVLESCRRIPLGGLSSMENRRPLLRKGRLLRGQIHHGLIGAGAPVSGVRGASICPHAHSDCKWLDSGAGDSSGFISQLLHMYMLGDLGQFT